jgi:hypothetical protein
LANVIFRSLSQPMVPLSPIPGDTPAHTRKKSESIRTRPGTKGSDSSSPPASHHPEDCFRTVEKMFMDLPCGHHDTTDQHLIGLQWLPFRNWQWLWYNFSPEFFSPKHTNTRREK